MEHDVTMKRRTIDRPKLIDKSHWQNVWQKEPDSTSMHCHHFIDMYLKRKKDKLNSGVCEVCSDGEM
jgi:hypothetical protein